MNVHFHLEARTLLWKEMRRRKAICMLTASGTVLRKFKVNVSHYLCCCWKMSFCMKNLIRWFVYSTKKTKRKNSSKSFQPEIHLMSNIHKHLKSPWLTLYNVFLIISIFISSKSCSEMHSTKNGAGDQIKNYFISLCLYSTIKKREERILTQQNY